MLALMVSFYATFRPSAVYVDVESIASLVVLRPAIPLPTTASFLLWLKLLQATRI